MTTLQEDYDTLQRIGDDLEALGFTVTRQDLRADNGLVLLEIGTTRISVGKHHNQIYSVVEGSVAYPDRSDGGQLDFDFDTDHADGSLAESKDSDSEDGARAGVVCVSEPVDLND